MTDFLFAKSDFLSGVASVLDIGGTLGELNTSRSEAEADMMALRSDWMTVGRDIRRAIDALISASPQ